MAVVWWHKVVVFPLRKVWCAVSARAKPPKKGAGLLKLHDDIQTCGYEDVQIMWEMLRTTQPKPISSHTRKRKNRRWFWRNLA